MNDNLELIQRWEQIYSGQRLVLTYLSKSQQCLDFNSNNFYAGLSKENSKGPGELFERENASFPGPLSFVKDVEKCL